MHSYSPSHLPALPLPMLLPPPTSADVACLNLIATTPSGFRSNIVTCSQVDNHEGPAGRKREEREEGERGRGATMKREEREEGGRGGEGGWSGLRTQQAIRTTRKFDHSMGVNEKDG
eukprot:760027-Hanusia_phi.AAC.1